MLINDGASMITIAQEYEPSFFKLVSYDIATLKSTAISELPMKFNCDIKTALDEDDDDQEYY